MAWLVAEDRVLATAEMAEDWRSRLVGLIGRDDLDGALVLRPARSVHTLGVRFPIDVAFCDRDLRVLEIVTMRPNRIGRPRPRARVVIEAPRGCFERWHVRPGELLELRQ